MKQFDPNDTIAIGFQVQYTLDDGKALAFSSCLDAECSKEQLNAALDKLLTAAERQHAKLKLPRLRKQYNRLVTDHERAKEDMFRLDAEASLADAEWRKRHSAEGRRGEFKLTPAQINERNKRDADRTNAEITYRRKDEELKMLSDEIADLEALVGDVNAVSSAANSNTSNADS